MDKQDRESIDSCGVDDPANDNCGNIQSYDTNNNIDSCILENNNNKDDNDDDHNSSLNDCGCCHGIEKVTPIRLTNPPGLSKIKYRIGTHSQFKSSMMANLQRLDYVRKTTLDNLTTREDDDLTIALLDSWATIADVLTFYQERIANEGFIRTATERKSVVELARCVGYELRPGVAADVFLAFSIDAPTTLDEKIRIPKGTKAQSMPTEGKLPQIFETTEDIEAHYEWSEVKPRLYRPQEITSQTTRFYFKGTNTLLKKGDLLLVILDKDEIFSTIVSEVQEDPKLERTIVDVMPPPHPPELQNRSIIKNTSSPCYASDIIQPHTFDALIGSMKNLKVDPTKITIEQLTGLTNHKWTKSDLNAFSIKYHFSLKEFFKVINKVSRDLKTMKEDKSVQVHTFRIKASVFGHNAPKYDALPSGNDGVGGEARSSYEADRVMDEGFPPPPWPWPLLLLLFFILLRLGPPPWPWPLLLLLFFILLRLGPPPWPWPMSKYPYDVEYAPVMRNSADNWFDLDNSYSEILPSTDENESWLVLTSYDESSAGPAGFNHNPHAYRIKDKRERSVSRYLVTAKVTSLDLLLSDVERTNMSSLTVRSTTVFAKSEQLELAESPIDQPIQSRSITLDRVMENELTIGQVLSISGEILDIEDKPTNIISSEIATISNIELDGIYTVLTLEKDLHNRYKRDSVVINANIAKATHGETKEEVIGGGDPIQRQQQFFLKQKPLTYISASTPNGIKNSLEVRVDGILWKEVPYLYGHSSNENVYIVRMDDKNNSKIIFGDDANGKKPDPGRENIRAKYRVGIGYDGLVQPENIKLLASRPLGVKSVINPIASDGAANPESLDNARNNATLNVLTMDRIISIKDAENFALAFAGIGKAHAISALNSQKKAIIRLTIASAFGSIVDKQSELYKNLSNAIRRYSDPSIEVVIQGFEKILFNVQAKIALSSDRKDEEVFSQVTEALLKRFSFELSQFLHPVTLSEVISTIHMVKGVIAVDIDRLYVYGTEATYNEIIPQSSAIIIGTNGSIQDVNEVREERDWLLVINPDGIMLSKMQL